MEGEVWMEGEQGSWIPGSRSSEDPHAPHWAQDLEEKVEKVASWQTHHIGMGAWSQVKENKIVRLSLYLSVWIWIRTHL